MTTNNHPAHGPLSLDRLHQISEILSKAAAQSDGGNLGYAMADAVKVIDGSIAAFDAEPVAYADPQAFDNFKSNGGKNAACTKEWMWRDPSDGLIPLYTAQPAPVVSGEYGDAYQGAREDLAIWKRRALEAEKEVQRLSDINDCLVKEAQGEARMGEPLIHETGPVVPNELLSAMEEVLRISDRDHEAWHKARNGIASCRDAMLQAGNSPVTPDCWCRTCRPVTMSDMRFVVCPYCGNKRCPRANDHRNACTGSNEPGQIGSAYPATPQQEVKNG
ncbi:hypothetical protein MLN09_21930 [Escherichia coli]|uniref:hypothetical protein n=1 Tax=Escherichia coli TaxID=562 RepID=UPI001FCF2359|nr:hypothetical protein [Escherichia coli]MCN1990854.1 hypothetical protein [Escherichia coli]MCN2363491.1 hypothetical protein [Escherichia coli]MCN6178556.1 hypothetical protein [Escherichia coli]